MVDRHVGLGTAAEGDLVAAVVPPVGDGLTARGVAEADHGGDLAPGVLALPAVAVAGVHRAAVRRTCVLVGPLVAGVDVGRAVGPGQHEHAGERVVGAVLVVQRLAVALGVVVVDEDGGLRGGHEAPALAEVLQVGEVLVVEDLLEAAGVAELLDVPGAGVLVGRDGLARAVDRLLLPVGAGVDQPGLDVGEVGGGHVLGRVDAEPVDAEREQVVQIAGDLAADVVLTGVQVGEAHELAVLDVGAVAVVADLRLAVVHVVDRVQAGVVVLGVRGPSGPRAGAGRHVVDDRVRHNLDARAVAGADHVGEGGAVAEPSGDPVADRLVRGPPLPALDVLLGRRDLYEAVAGRAEGVGTRLGDGVELPLEENGGDVLGARGGGLCVRGGDHECGGARYQGERGRQGSAGHCFLLRWGKCG